jgi:hypothetical protein
MVTVEEEKDNKHKSNEEVHRFEELVEGVPRETLALAVEILVACPEQRTSPSG